MDDLISRKAAIEALANAGCINYEASGDTYGMITAVNVIKGMPGVETTIEDEIAKYCYKRNMVFCSGEYLHKLEEFRLQSCGMWLDGKGKPIQNWTGYLATCSHCHEESEYLTDYCPNCGAKMLRSATRTS